MTGSRLLEWRRRRGLSLRGAGELLGVSAMTLSRWERGLCRIPAAVEMAIEHLSEPATWRDYGQRPVRVGDLVLDDRGKVYRILETDRPISMHGLAIAQEVRRRNDRWEDDGEPTYVRVYHTFVLNPDRLGQEDDNRKLWQSLYEKLAHLQGEGSKLAG
ncbi:MAG: helix-turn-helix domain-containing protein [Dehalococcoidia bacterium]